MDLRRRKHTAEHNAKISKSLMGQVRKRDGLNKYKRYRNKLLQEVLEIYGGECACCGFSDYAFSIYGKRFLQIDHVKGGGRRELREKFSGRYNAFLVYLRDNKPEGYRLLCAGCNVSMPPGAEKCILRHS